MLKSSNRKSQTGYTMLEVLVAIVVLALGMLGLAALQSVSMRSGHSASLRTQATVLAYSVIDSMRANRCNAKLGAYDIVMSAEASGSLTTLAQEDVANWLQEVARRMPSGDGQIRRSVGCADGATLITPAGCDSTPTPVAVVVQWNDERGIGGLAGQRLCVVSQI